MVPRPHFQFGGVTLYNLLGGEVKVRYFASYHPDTMLATISASTDGSLTSGPTSWYIGEIITVVTSQATRINILRS